MSCVRLCLLLCLALVAGWLHGAVSNDEASQAADETSLREAGVATDNSSLLEFFRKRTLSEAEQSKLAETVRRLGDNSFAIREKASQDLMAAGRTALPFLRPAVKDPDLEIARRAQRCLDEIESGSGTSLALAASRLLSLRRPMGATEVILNFLPFADDETLEDELRNTLSSVGVRDGKADDQVLAAINDKIPMRRAAAAMVLGQSTDPQQQAIVKRLLTDPDARVRFRAAQGLLSAKEKDSVPVLIALLTDAPIAISWQAEELLCRVAGEQSPQIAVGAGEDADRRKCRDAWIGWWREAGPKLELSKLDWEQRALGLTLIVVYDGYNNGQGRIWEFGPDRNARWSIDNNIQGPIDGQMLSGNRILLAEYNARKVSERDLKGKILWEHQINGNPVACQRLPNGNTFVATLNTVMEVTHEGKEVYTHTIPQNQVTFAQKLRSGVIAHISSNGMLVEMDEKGKVLKSLKVGGNASEWLTFEVLPGGRYLVPQQNGSKLVEYDGNGRVVWEGTAPRPYSATRLPNGNTIACSMNDSRLFEVDRAGKVIWDQKLQGRPFRIRRR